MSSQQQTSSPSRIVEVVVPFREDESFVDRLARANAALGRAIHAQLPAWDVKRNEIAVFGPQRAHRNGSVSYVYGSTSFVYRLVEDRKPLFGKGRGAERALMRHEIWSQQPESAAQ